jgi:hypothetical protein
MAYTHDIGEEIQAVVNGLDFIVSLNFQHIVREWTINKVAAINAAEGYRQIGLYKPGEVLE